ncbi:unnamed protein product [Rotaria sordida]|uniref:Uncharacterized protein n=1 Tax=Rotaria sordida TaxID=392033 RepID=A0A818UJ18_9BILA|nr:unnamed protein product [Rotaria sordida]
MMLPSIKRLVILNAEDYSYVLIKPLLTSLAFHNNTLQRYEFYKNNLIEDLKMEQLCWPNTVELSLSIEHSSEIMFFFRNGALPLIEHLNITNEEICIILPEHHHKYENKSISNIKFYKNELNEIVDSTRLKSLFLRYIFLNDLIILMNSLTMPLLEKLTLIDLYDYKIEESWRISPFNYNREWPFDNIDYYVDETLFLDVNGVSIVERSQFIIYKHPINILLEHKRTLHNHRFATHASMPIITNRRRSLQLTWNQMDNPDQLLKTLQIVGSSHLNKLDLIYRNDLINVPMISNYPSSCHLLFNHLRSMIFQFKTERIKETERIYIVKQILDSSPNLSHIEIAWNDFRHCSQKYSNLQHVHLLLDRLCRQAKEPFNIDRLNELAPNLCCLEISGAYLMFNENLVQFIFKIIHRFGQLVYLTLNKDDLYKSKDDKKILFKKRLIEIDNGRLFHSNDIQIVFPQLDKLYIWI